MSHNTLALAIKSLRNMAARLPQMGTNPQHAMLIILKKKKKSADLCLPSRCGGGNDSGGGWAGASEGPIPAHNNGITANPRCLPACVPVSREAGAGPSKQKKNKQTKKQTKSKKKKTVGWDLCTHNGSGVSGGAWQ